MILVAVPICAIFIPQAVLLVKVWTASRTLKQVFSWAPAMMEFTLLLVVATTSETAGAIFRTVAKFLAVEAKFRVVGALETMPRPFGS